MESSVATIDIVESPIRAFRFPVDAHLLDTFGSPEAASEWLNDFCPALGARPADLMGDEQGRMKVDHVLGCIDHGIVY